MKAIILNVSLILLLILNACAPKIYYQLHEVALPEKTTLINGSCVYEDHNCQIFYNLWAENGDIGFRFYNKTNENIYLNMEESFYIFNDMASDYYKERTYTSSSSTGSTLQQGINTAYSILPNQYSPSKSTAVMASNSFSVSFNEEKVICIPSRTSKSIREYVITHNIFRDCGLFLYPESKTQYKTLSFNENTSPITFGNRITYSVGKNGPLVVVNNHFFVKNISNYPERNFVSSKLEEFCDQKISFSGKYYEFAGPDKFYIRYVKTDNWKH